MFKGVVGEDSAGRLPLSKGLKELEEQPRGILGERCSSQRGEPRQRWECAQNEKEL